MTLYLSSGSVALQVPIGVLRRQVDILYRKTDALYRQPPASTVGNPDPQTRTLVRFALIHLDPVQVADTVEMAFSWISSIPQFQIHRGREISDG